jgi:hypothetical protein
MAASETGGVWLLTRSASSPVGLPLSMEWRSAVTSSLSHGSRGQYHILCGGLDRAGNGVLHETDITARWPLWAPWNQIQLDSRNGPIGAITKVLVWRTTIVLATSNGLYHAEIPAAHAPYVWQAAEATPTARGASTSDERRLLDPA